VKKYYFLLILVSLSDLWAWSCSPCPPDG